MDKIVCKKAGTYRVITPDGYSDPFMTKDGQVVSRKYAFAAFTAFEGEKYYSEPCRQEITFYDLTYSYVVHKDAGSDGWYMDDYYFTKEEYEQIFRPFVSRYLCAKPFNNIDDMNVFLKNIGCERVKDVHWHEGPGWGNYVVLYEERGDE